MPIILSLILGQNGLLGDSARGLIVGIGIGIGFLILSIFSKDKGKINKNTNSFR